MALGSRERPVDDEKLGRRYDLRIIICGESGLRGIGVNWFSGGEGEESAELSGEREGIGNRSSAGTI